MNECRSISRIGAYYDDELAPEERREIAEHLPACPACRAELASLKDLSTQLAMLPAMEVSAAALQRIHTRVDAQVDLDLLRMARALLAVAAGLFITLSIWVSQIHTDSAATTDDSWSQIESLMQDPRPDSLALAGADLNLAQDMLQGLSAGGGQ